MSNYHVAISGCDHGLGLALCKACLRLGYRVYAGHYKADSADLATLKQDFPDQILAIPLDCGDDVSIKTFVGEVYKHSKKLDVLINNAAMLGNIDTGIDASLDFEEMETAFRINTLGPLRLIQAALPLLRAGNGKCIANISSEAASIGANFRDRWFAYCMSKAALNRQSALIYEALKNEGFAVLCLHPGHLRTHMRGELDTSASLTADDVAGPLFKLIQNPPKPFGFWDFERKELGW